MSARQNLLGRTYGRLTVIEFAYVKKHYAFWKCQCTCGETTTVAAYSLKSGNTSSCGCLYQETIKKQNVTHGQSSTREYRIWKAMKTRCFNKNSPHFSDYGGRGITIYKPWITSFSQFIDHIGLCPDPTYTLDRIDNNGNYEPGNVKWSSRSDQSNNTRSVRLLEYKNEKKTLRQWTTELKLNHKMIDDRLKEGWSVDVAFETPFLDQPRNTIYLEMDGKTQMIKDWAKDLNMPYSTLHYHISKGKTLKEIVIKIQNKQQKLKRAP